MSQQKVDRYKEEKANRKELMAKEQQKKKMTRIGIWACIALVVIGLGTSVGISIRNSHNRYLASLPDYTRTSMVVQDYTGITETEAAAE